MATILFTGANGNVSSTAIAALHGKGHRLIALVRDEAKGAHLAKQGVELRVGDLDRLRSVEGAFTGVDTAFLLTVPGNLAPAQMSNALWGAREGGVKHVVRLSAVGASHTAPTINSRYHALSDSELAGSGIAYTILKPHFFAQNLLMAAQSIREQGALYFALADAKLPMIDVRDVGAVVAAVVADPVPHANKTYTLTGPAAISLHQFAAAAGEALGKQVTYQPIPVDRMVEQLAQFGIDDYGQTAMRDYFRAYSSGWHADVTTAVKDLTGREPIGIQQFARDFFAR